eukprot:COSAG02_NODE_2272_length_9263_cov_212.913902_6_plen_153_part_00
MATIDITKVWPTFNYDVAKLYDLAEKLLPKHDRSKTENRKEWTHSFGVKQLGMGENKDPILLKIKNKPGYHEFLKHAAVYFVKQQMLEEMIAPDNSKTRKTMRDEHMTDSCCAIPGLYIKLTEESMGVRPASSPSQPRPGFCGNPLGSTIGR